MDRRKDVAALTPMEADGHGTRRKSEQLCVLATRARIGPTVLLVEHWKWSLEAVRGLVPMFL